MKRLLRTSLTFRLTLLFSCSATLVLLVLGIVVADAVDRHFVDQDLEALTGKLTLVRHAFGRIEDRTGLAQLPTQLDSSLVGHHGLAVTVLDGRGRAFFTTEGVEFPDRLVSQAPIEGYAGPFVWKTRSGHFRGIAGTAATGYADWPQATVVIAMEISHHEAFMEAFRETMWLIVVCAAVLLGFLGWVATRHGLAPLQQLVAEAEAITASRLNRRLPTHRVPLEVAEVADTLNAMLARLEDSFKRLSDFSSDLAHELRTPISNLMTQTQVALSRARTADEYSEILSSNAEELERLARTISDMLFLAKSDNGLIVPSQETVKLETEIQDLFDFYEALAESRGLRLSRHGEASVQGDHLMLRRAISNLLSNAVRYAHEGTEIRVELATADERARVVVENRGDTIPENQLSRLFDRFYRGDSSRHRTTEGAGLGLAITSSILRAHGGTTSVSSREGVTRFVLDLPLVQGGEA